MATRSFILRYSPNTNTYTGIYCHWDGYPQYVGVMLRDHYSHDGELQVLIGRGDISSLLTPGGRDMAGEDIGWKTFGEKARTFDYLSEALDYAKGCGCEHAYLWDPTDRVWCHYELSYQPKSLDGVESLLELQNRAQTVGL